MRRAGVWVHDQIDEVRERLLDKGARPRLLVPTPNGTFVLGPNPATPRTVADTRALLGGGVGLVWDDTGVRVDHAEPLGGDPGAGAADLFRQAGLFPEAEIVRWIEQGAADPAIPVHPRRWWEPLVGENTKNGLNRARGVTFYWAWGIPLLVLGMATQLLLAFQVVEANRSAAVLLLIGCVGALILPGHLLVLTKRWRQELPVLDPHGVLATPPSRLDI